MTYFASTILPVNQMSLIAQTKFEISDKTLHFLMIPSFYHFIVSVIWCSKYAFFNTANYTNIQISTISKIVSRMFQFQNLCVDMLKYEFTTNIQQYLCWPEPL